MKLGNNAGSVQVYDGYGYTNNFFITGHVLKKNKSARRHYTNNSLANTIHIIKMFSVKPLANIPVQLIWMGYKLYSVTRDDGFFLFEWKAAYKVAPGWHDVKVNVLDKNEVIQLTGKGRIYVPHSTQYAFISDIDDTVLVSHSSSILKKLKTLLTKNPYSRKVFEDAVEHYRLLSIAHTDGSITNPFFYVSSSEWNLYDDLKHFFTINQLPQGIFLLNDLTSWYRLLNTRKTKHNGKLIWILRILNDFPNQKFVLLGDNSQKDPVIYASIVKKYPERIIAVYIRNIDPGKEILTTDLLTDMEDHGIETCFFKENSEAILHSKKIGLIDR
jgi:phosphatidate phosphatase APP1